MILRFCRPGHPGAIQPESVSRAGKRYWRTFILGAVALAGLVWMAVAQFDVPMAELRQLFLGSLLALFIVILAAGLFALAWMGLRRLMRRD